MRNGALRSVAKGRRGMTNEATPAILINLYLVVYFPLRLYLTVTFLYLCPYCRDLSSAPLPASLTFLGDILCPCAPSCVFLACAPALFRP